MDGKLKLTPAGFIVQESWLLLTSFIGNIILDEFIVMPNHIHGIIEFTGTPFFKSTNREIDLMQIISMFKSRSSNLICRGMPLASQKSTLTNKIWQKSFYEHVIRNEKDLLRIQEYILNNPLNWEIDLLNSGNQDTVKLL